VTRNAIVDTGPLVAFLDRGERHHAWVAEQVRKLDAPLLVCEPVLAESFHLLSRHPAAQEAILGLLEKGVLRIGFQLSEQLAEVASLCRKYRDVPMSLADACVVRMAELHERHAVFTLDSDFKVYRRYGNEPLPMIFAEKAQVRDCLRSRTPTPTLASR
jgi:predicted nucleic acid-binding protein